jgi:glutaredoxin 3
MTKVVVYTGNYCGYCVRAKRLLDARGISFEEINLDRSAPELRTELVARTGQRTVPQIFVGSSHVGGSDELTALDRAGGLEDLLAREGISRS